MSTGTTNKNTANTTPAPETTPAATTGKKNGLQTPKAKSRLGVPADHVITWVPFALPADDNAILKAIAKTRDVSIHAVVAPVLAQWFEDNRAALVAEADEFLKTTEKSPEELEKELAKLRAAQARLEAMLNGKK